MMYEISKEKQSKRQNADIETEARRLIVDMEKAEAERLAPLRKLNEALKKTLQYDSDAKLEDILQDQAKVLDNAFKTLLAQPDDDKDKISHYNTAFRAQAQFRYTAKTVLDIEKDKKPKTLKNNKTTPEKK